MNITQRRYIRSQPPSRHRPNDWLSQALAASLGGLLIFALALGLISLGYRLVFWGRVLPGVHVAGINLGGLSRAQAQARLEEQFTYPYGGAVVFRDGPNSWTYSPAQLGWKLNAAASLERAYAYGREGGFLSALANAVGAAYRGAESTAVVEFDQAIAQNALQPLADQINRPSREAQLDFQNGSVSAVPGQSGRELNLEATLTLLSAQLQTLRSGDSPLVIVEHAPAVLDSSPLLEQARALLATGFILSLPNPQAGDPGPWQITPADLPALLRVGLSPEGRPALTVDSQNLLSLLREISRQTNRPAENARFTFDDASGQLIAIQPSRTGRRVDEEASLQAVQQALSQGAALAVLQVQENAPQVSDTASGASLGITQNIATYTSYFRGSSAARMTNIETAASRFHGLLVAPGETFSMGQSLGDVSLDSGFAEALIIYGGRTIKGVGGGVCQVSTTLFRTAFFAGFPIVERYAHAYRVYYYEQNASGLDTTLAGLDATVYFPVVDFKFTNDTPYWLLMETYFDPVRQSLTWKFYSTSDNRVVQWETSGLQNQVSPPPPVIQYNGDLPEGSFKQVDWAAEGADITVNRTVLIGDKIHFMDKFVTHYAAWGDICEYGPGVTDPEKIAKRKNLCWGKP